MSPQENKYIFIITIDSSLTRVLTLYSLIDSTNIVLPSGDKHCPRYQGSSCEQGRAALLSWHLHSLYRPSMQIGNQFPKPWGMLQRLQAIKSEGPGFKSRLCFFDSEQII